jgi:glutathione S-transferase
MKLYYSPGACSLSPHIALHEAGLAFEAVKAPTKTHQLDDGTDYYTINPLGYVPLLELDDGTRLREGPAIVQYIADQVPAKNLAPANGTLARYKLQSWLTFIGTELHRRLRPAVQPRHPERMKVKAGQGTPGRPPQVGGRRTGRQAVPDGRPSAWPTATCSP